MPRSRSIAEKSVVVAPSCSLLHSPVDLDREDQLDAELHSWLAFAVQKCQEVALLAKAINAPHAADVAVVNSEHEAQFFPADAPAPAVIRLPIPVIHSPFAPEDGTVVVEGTITIRVSDKPARV